MGRSLLWGAIFFAILLAAATTRSDVFTESSPPTGTNVATPEPITASAAVNAPGDEQPRHDPFTLYPVGPIPTDKSPKPLWSYADLRPEEQAVVDRGRNATGWAPTHNAFAAASAELAQRAAADSAASQLGVSNLGAIGVVP